MTNSPSDQSSTTGPIIGGVLGGVTGIAIVCAILWYYVHGQRRSYPSAMVPAAFKTSSWEAYCDHYTGGTPLPTVHEVLPSDPGLPPTMSMRRPLPPSPSNAATGGYDTTILADLAMTPPREECVSHHSMLTMFNADTLVAGGRR